MATPRGRPRPVLAPQQMSTSPGQFANMLVRRADEAAKLAQRVRPVSISAELELRKAVYSLQRAAMKLREVRRK